MSNPLSYWTEYLAGLRICGLSVALTCSRSANVCLPNRHREKTTSPSFWLSPFSSSWPGVSAAQKVLHQKSKKPSFQILFWATVVLNCGILGGLYWFSGAAVFRSFPGAS
jgi:uncharacterized membrane protein YsdA (DUF1294 family)